MKTIYIVGGDGFARECYSFLQKPLYGNEQIVFGGFLGHGGYGHTVDYKTFQYLYRGEVAEHSFTDNEYVVIGAGYPKLREKIYCELKARNIKFYNLISENSNVSDTAVLGEANIIIGGTYFTVNVIVGNGNVFNGSVIVGHDCKIGDFNFFGARSQLLGNSVVGNMNQIGVNSILLPKAKIGNNNKIAPLSAVYKGCKDNCYLLGNPALKEGIVE